MEIDAYLSKKQKRRKKRRAYFFGVAAFVVVYLIALGIFWIIFHSPLFRVDRVVVQGNVNVPSDAVVALLQASVLKPGDELKHGNSWFRSFFGFKNMLIWPGALPADDLTVLPALANITISKDYFSHTITATVTERQASGIWCFVPKTNSAGNPSANEPCYWFDSGGFLFEKAFDTQGSSLFAIQDYSQTDPGLGKNILPDEFIPNLVSIVNVVASSGISVDTAALNDIGLEEIDITTYNGPELYFSLRFPADEDLPVLQSLMAKSDFGKLEYIDFRVENRAYYK